jgi:hypothetical protein
MSRCPTSVPGGTIASMRSRTAKFIVAKRGLAAALHLGDPAFAALPAYFQQHLGPALQTLLIDGLRYGANRDRVAAHRVPGLN